VDNDLKEQAHQLLQQGVQRFPPFEGGLLVRWVCVMELALPDSSHTLVKLSSDASGRDLFKWEAVGLMSVAQERAR